MVATLATLIAEGCSFVAECNGCGRRRAIPAKGFCAPHETPVSDIAKLMKCSSGCDALITTYCQPRIEAK